VADDLFASDKAKVKEVCGEIQKGDFLLPGAPLRGSIRLTGETLQTMKDTGCEQRQFWRSNQEIRRCSSGSGKKITLDQVPSGRQTLQ